MWVEHRGIVHRRDLAPFLVKWSIEELEKEDDAFTRLIATLDAHFAYASRAQLPSDFENYLNLLQRPAGQTLLITERGRSRGGVPEAGGGVPLQCKDGIFFAETGHNRTTKTHGHPKPCRAKKHGLCRPQSPEECVS